MSSLGIIPALSLLAIAGVALFALYIFVMGLNPFRKRRILTGLSLFAISALAAWAWSGSQVQVPRAVVLVYSDQTSVDQLRSVLASLHSTDQVTALRITRDAAPTTTGNWNGPGGIGPGPAEPGNQYLERLSRSAGVVSLQPDHWLDSLIDADRRSRAAFPLMHTGVYQHTLIVLLDNGPTWDKLGRSGLELTESLARLQNPATEVYLFPGQTEQAPGWLDVELSREVLPSVPIKAMISQSVRVVLRGADRIRTAGDTYALQLWLDGGPANPGEPHFTLSAQGTDPGPGRELQSTTTLDEFWPAAGQKDTPLIVGLHRVFVRLVIHPGQPGVAPLEYTASRYFLVEQRGMLLLHNQSLGTLAQSTWAGPIPANPAALFRDYLNSRNKTGQRSRTEFAPESLIDHSFNTSPAILIADLRSCRVLILDEPSPEQLIRLSAELNLEKRIREDGLTVVLIRPPAIDQPRPDWLKVVAETETPGHAVEVHRKRQIFFCSENLRLLKFPNRAKLKAAPNPDDMTGLRAQQDVIQKVCQQLGIAEFPIEVKDGVNPYLEFPAIKEPRQGRFVHGDVEVPITVHPPRAPMLDYDPAKQHILETVVASIPERLSILDQASPPLSGPDYHPGTSVVLFMDDLPQLDVIPADARQLFRRAGTNEPWPESKAGENPIADLVQRGVTVYAVRFQLDPIYARSLSRNIRGGQSAEAFLAPIRGNSFLHELPLALTTESVLDVSDQIGRSIREGGGTISRQRGARVIDERTISPHEAPERHLLLRRTDTPRSKLDGPFAVIEDSRFVENHRVRRAPTIESYSLREGTVVVLGYSPFARDVWQRDAGSAAGKEPDGQQAGTVNGWGVQRLIDAIEITTPGRPLSRNHPLLRGARVADDGATLWVDCWADFSSEKTWIEPTLRQRTQAVPGRLHRFDRSTGNVTFQVQPPLNQSLRGWFTLELGDIDSGPESRPVLFVDLQPMQLDGRSTREALARLAGLTGGTVLNRGSTMESLACSRPAAWLVSFLLVGLALFLLSPLVRRWSLFRRRRHGELVRGDRRMVSLDVPGILAEWGMNAGAPRSTRQAGDPAGQKPYESGDPLSAARSSTLFPLFADAATIPPRRPIVRERYSGRALEAIILLDCTSSLFGTTASPTPAQYVVELTRLLAGAIWSTAGQVCVQSIQQPELTWGPHGGGEDSEELIRFVNQAIQQGARKGYQPLRLPEGMASGQLLFLVSDLLAPHYRVLGRFLTECAAQEISCRVIHVQLPPGEDGIGLGRSALTGRLLDRTEWTPDDLIAAHEEHLAQIRPLVEAGGGRFATVAVNLRMEDAMNVLVLGEILS
jgi:hypothetical protein